MTIRAMIIDDEPLARFDIRNSLNEFPDVEVIAEADNATDAIALIEEHQPDVLFLDIQLPGRNGFELLEDLSIMPPKVVFITAYDEFAVKAFEADAIDYLLKPTNHRRLNVMIERLRKELKQTIAQTNTKHIPIEKKIFFKDGNRCYFVRISDIFLIESVGNYSKFYFEDQKPLIHSSLSKVQERLNPTTFFRANRQFIVNTEFISNINSHYKCESRVRHIRIIS